MSFSHPLLLLAGIGLLIPIIIHLYNLRKFKRIYFSDTRLIEDIITKSKKHATIEKWLLLASRLLIMASIIWAFAEPFFNNKKTSAVPTATIIHIDNSLSMSYADGQQSLLDKSKAAILQALKGSDVNQKFYITTNDQKHLGNSLTLNDAIQYIQSIHYAQEVFSVTDQIKVLNNTIIENGIDQANLLIVSDFSINPNDTVAIDVPENVANLSFINIKAENFENIAIKDAFFTQPYLVSSQPNELAVTLQKYGKNNSASTNVSIYNGDKLLTSGTINWEDKTQITDTFSLNLPQSDWYNLQISIQPDHLVFDDTFFISGKASPQRAALVIGSQINPHLQAAFNAIPEFTYQLQANLSAAQSSLENYSLIVVQELNNLNAAQISVLKSALSSGKNVWIIPGANQTNQLNAVLEPLTKLKVQQWDTTTQMVNKIQTNHHLFKSVFKQLEANTQYPKVNGRYTKANYQALDELPILIFRDGQPLLASYNQAEYVGNLFVMYSPLDVRMNSLLNANYFAPMIMRMAEMNASAHTGSHELGTSQPFRIAQTPSEAVWHISNATNDIIPVQRREQQFSLLYTQQQPLHAGIYKISQLDNASAKYIGLNWNRIESNYEAATEEKLAALLSGYKINFASVDQIHQYVTDKAQSNFPLWKVGIVIALLAMLLETWLLTKK